MNTEPNRNFFFFKNLTASFGSISPLDNATRHAPLNKIPKYRILNYQKIKDLDLFQYHFNIKIFLHQSEKEVLNDL